MSGATDPSYAEVAADIGLAQLRTLDPSLTGAGVTVGQVEGSASGVAGAVDFEVDPAQVGHLADNADHFFTFIRSFNRTFVYNDGTIGAFSQHATTQASFFYGETTGVAPGVAHVDNYFAVNFTDNLPSPPDKVVNMSFLYDPPQNFDGNYDASAINNNIVFVGSAGNNNGTSPKPGSPGSAYNVIDVDSSTSFQAIGPTSNGVHKPDISAPQNETSRTAAIVSGCATLLVQAGNALNNAAAVDFRTIKALLLNGATKPADYDTNAYAPNPGQPLSAVYGSGQVNILNSVQELDGGAFAAGATSSVTLGTTLSMPVALTPIASAQGWNLGSLTATAGHDAIDSYGLNLAAGQGVIATLTWAADAANAIDFLELDLVNNVTGAVLAQSAAPLSNVQQIRFKAAATTSVVLEVRLHGSATNGLSDKYALAFAPLATVACFCPGARILTDRGAMPIETLRPGHRVATASGRLAPIRSIGRSRAHATPVRIAAHAFGPGRPHGDLYLSPDHAVAISGTLVPVRHLTNGASVAAMHAQRASWLHVELDRHAVILANGLPVECYLDTGNRAAFDDQSALALSSAVHPRPAP
jgi:hypothetical protein